VKGGLTFSNLIKSLIYIVSYFNLGGGLELCLGGAKPTTAHP